jgi:hypothetical protein
MLLMIRVPVPVLLSVTVCGELFAPIVWEPKLRSLTDQLATGNVPVPLKGIAWGLPEALSVICIVADLAPTTLGENAAEILQLPPATKLLPQLFDTSGAKSRRSAPATKTLVRVSVAVPVFVKVTVWAVPVVLTV